MMNDPAARLSKIEAESLGGNLRLNLGLFLRGREIESFTFINTRVAAATKAQVVNNFAKISAVDVWSMELLPPYWWMLTDELKIKFNFIIIHWSHTHSFKSTFQ